MVYRMDFYVDGGCRRNGKPGAIAAFAAVRKYRWGKHRHWKERHPVSPTPTSSRAELLAIILALKKAFERYEKLHEPKPKLKVKIYSDSKYGTGCINEWVHKWVADGWKNSRGTEVANLDLVQELYELHQRLKKLGSVKYTWIPRAENNDADGYCNKVLDAMEIEQKRQENTTIKEAPELHMEDNVNIMENFSAKFASISLLEIDSSEENDW